MMENTKALLCCSAVCCLATNGRHFNRAAGMNHAGIGTPILSLPWSCKGSHHCPIYCWNKWLIKVDLPDDDSELIIDHIIIVNV